MPRPRRWSELVPGVTALVAVAGITVSVLVFARVGALHGRTERLYATVDAARGLSAGSEVWLGGQRVGLVRAIRFRDVSPDTSQPLLLELDVLAKARAIVHRGATVDVRAGGNFIGAPVVAVGFGSPNAPVITDVDTLHSARHQDLDSVRAQYAAAGAQVPEIVANLKVLASQLGAARGTLGALGVDGMPNTASVAAGIASVRRGVSSGDGTIAHALRDDALSHRAALAMASADSIRVLLADSARTSLGRFRRDSTLFAAIDAVRTELADVARRAATPTGMIGRIRADSALRWDIARTREEMAALATDVKRHPLRYLNASTF